MNKSDSFVQDSHTGAMWYSTSNITWFSFEDGRIFLEKRKILNTVLSILKVKILQKKIANYNKA